MKKTYALKTVEDITNVVNEKNLSNFIIDFTAWLTMRVVFKKSGIDEKVIKFDNSQFRWIDDGKHDKLITIKSMEEINGLKNRT